TRRGPERQQPKAPGRGFRGVENGRPRGGAPAIMRHARDPVVRGRPLFHRPAASARRGAGGGRGRQRGRGAAADTRLPGAGEAASPDRPNPGRSQYPRDRHPRRLQHDLACAGAPARGPPGHARDRPEARSRRRRQPRSGRRRQNRGAAGRAGLGVAGADRQGRPGAVRPDFHRCRQGGDTGLLHLGAQALPRRDRCHRRQRGAQRRRDRRGKRGPRSPGRPPVQRDARGGAARERDGRADGRRQGIRRVRDLDCERGALSRAVNRPRPPLLAFAGLLLVAECCGPFAGAAEARYEASWASLDTRACPEWYLDAKFGIFIHWGVYSVPAWGVKGEYSEWYWYRIADRKPDNPWWQFHKANYGEGFQYQDFAPRFTCELFDPKLWADILARSGARYVVPTSKHHDGFCMWPSAEASRDWGRPWNSAEAGPRRDLLGELSEAVRARGLRFGLYYSLYEWFNPLWLTDRPRYVDAHLLPQFKDVVTRYRPAIIFSDGEWEMTSK